MKDRDLAIKKQRGRVLENEFIMTLSYSFDFEHFKPSTFSPLLEQYMLFSCAIHPSLFSFGLTT